MDDLGVVKDSTGTGSSHLCVGDCELPFWVCVPEKLVPQPIILPVNRVPFIAIEPVQDPWVKTFSEAGDAILTVWFPGQKTQVENRDWRETEQGERFVGARGIHLECVIPSRMCTEIDPRNAPVDVVWNLFGMVVERMAVSIRWRTGQYWIDRTDYVIGLTLQAVWHDAHRNRRATCSGSAGRLPYWGDRERIKVIGAEEWKQVEADLQTEDEPLLHQIFLWDARNSMDGNDVVRGILYAAVGLEIFTKQFYEVQGGKKDPVYPWIVEKGGGTQPPFHEYYDSLAKCFCGRTLKEDDPDTFKWVRKLFETRNKIMHEGKAYFRSSTGKAEYEAHQGSLGEMLLAAEKAIDWLTAHGTNRSAP